MALPSAITKIARWALNGDRTDPDDASLDPTLTRTTGWPSTFSAADGDTPRRRVLNQILHELTTFCVEVRERNILEWDAGIDFPQHGYCQHGATLQRALVATGPTTGNATDPSTSGQTVWARVDTPRVVAVPDAPAAPVGIVGNGRIDWEWPCPADNGAAITGFRIQWREQGGSWSATRQVDITHPSHLLQSGLTNGQTYEARVYATNSAGNSVWSPTGSAVPVASVPDRVQQLIAEPSDGAINLQWSTPEDNGAAIIRFEIQWKSGTQNWASTRQISDTASPATIPNLTNGTSYDVRVRAVNSEGNGDWSSVVSNTPAPGEYVFTANGMQTWPWSTARGRAVVEGSSGAPTRDSTKDISILGSNPSLVGAVSDGSTIWIIDDSSNIALAHNASTRVPDATKNIDLGSGTWTGGASDGTTLWFANDDDNSLRAYVAATRARDSSKDILNLGVNPNGALCDGTTLWVVTNNNTAQAYVAATRVRDSAKDISLGTGTWAGGTSDGTTLWFVDRGVASGEDAAVAYNASTRARDSAKDIDFGQDATWTGAVYASGTVWAVNDASNMAIAFNVSPPSRLVIAGTTYTAGHHALAGIAVGASISATVDTGGYAIVYPVY